MNSFMKPQKVNCLLLRLTEILSLSSLGCLQVIFLPWLVFVLLRAQSAIGQTSSTFKSAKKVIT